MKCPDCKKHMRYDEDSREYYCPRCDMYIEENQLWFAPNYDELIEKSDLDH